LAISGDMDLGGSVAALRSSAQSSAQNPSAFLWFHNVPRTGNFSGHLTLMRQPQRVIAIQGAWFRYTLLQDQSVRSVFQEHQRRPVSDLEFGGKGL
jgi:hypothetical protein